MINFCQLSVNLCLALSAAHSRVRAVHAAKGQYNTGLSPWQQGLKATAKSSPFPLREKSMPGFNTTMCIKIASFSLAGSQPTLQ